MLAPVLFTYQRQNMTMGYYAHHRFIHRTGKAKASELAINPSYFLNHPVRECLQTLVHEMCHAYQYQYGKPSRNGYHNAEWAAIMERVGLMPSDTGKPGGKKTGQRIADYALPGGPFELATNELLEAGFQIAWLDRFPPKEVRPPALSQVQPASSAGPIESGFIASEEGRALGTVPMLDTLAPAVRAELVFVPASVNRSNRLKYSCGCGQNVWGKPALRIRCELCDTPFAPTS